MTDEQEAFWSDLNYDCDRLAEQDKLTADELTAKVTAILFDATRGARQGRLDLYGLHQVLERLVTELDERGYDWVLHEELADHGVAVDQRQRNTNGTEGAG